MRAQSLYKFGDTGYIIPELKEINRFAYFNYQRDKVYIKTSKVLKQTNKRTTRTRVQKPNQVIIPSKQKKCPFCEGEKLYHHYKRNKYIVDLKFTDSCVKRWIISYKLENLRCASCGKVFTTDRVKYPSKFGRNLRIWCVNQNISYNISFNCIIASAREQFKIKLTAADLPRFKHLTANEYKHTFENIKSHIIKGSLVQIDETQIKVKGFEGKCYVWAFATIDTVFYLFRENREAEFLKDLLKDFQGVVVSDFYTGYDSLECVQQKCLIHLMRDLNDDLLKNPFNEEFTFIINSFAKLLRNISNTINKHGLKRRHLNKHVKESDRFFGGILKKDFETEIAKAYCKKFKKYQEKLFAFLKYDGIPWNNNNAEVAIKPFAIHRNNLRGLHTENGIKDYLILLSIQQTCKYRNMSFYEFLKSNNKHL